MSISFTPFTKQQLMPQEEKLEVARRKSDLFIGIPNETSYQERRICLTPDAVNSLTFNGHRVMIEAGALEVSEEILVTAIEKAHTVTGKIIAAIEDFAKKNGCT